MKRQSYTIQTMHKPVQAKKIQEKHQPTQERELQEPSMPHRNMLLTIPQVAGVLGISRAHVYKLIPQGLPTIHLGRAIRVHTDSLQQWLLEQETTA